MQEPIRILFLFTILNRGGSETMVMNYYRCIDRSKVQFDFVVHRESRGIYEDEIEQMGGHIYRMMPLRPWSIPQYKQQIRQFFDEHPDYRIIHGLCSELGYYIYREASRRKIPVIIAHAQNSKADIDLKWFWRTWYKIRMRPYLTHMFACSADAANWLFGRNSIGSVTILPNAIDTKYFRFDLVKRTETRRILGINNDTLVIGHVGRFDKQKNHKLILKTFHYLHQINSKSVLLLVGKNGGLENQIKQLVTKLQLNDSVRFLGTSLNVVNELCAMDVFLFPSFMEGLGIALVEAQCTGLPCVVSDTIPKEAIMTDLITSLSVYHDSEEVWANAIIRQTSFTRNRYDYAQQIEDAGYDVSQNALWLQNFYMTSCRY